MNCIILLLLFVLPPIVAVVISKEKCDGKFYCPDSCSISWMDGCPHNCNCGSLKKCPLVSCPARKPICSVHTQLDGCQTCACKLPYLLVQEADNFVGFIFVGREDAPIIRTQLDDSSDFKMNGKKILKAQMCTISFMDKVDICIKKAMIFNKFIRSKRFDEGILTLNPMVQTRKTDLKKMCILYTAALLCMGKNIFRECRHLHPDLSELDAIFGFVCGPKERLFFDHLDCIQNSHLHSRRLAMCEESTYRALRFIQNSAFDIDDKQKQKCDAMTWLMNCEKPTIQKRCSLEARVINDQALVSAVDYVAPECHSNSETNTFVSDEQLALLDKETPVCSAPLKQEIKQQFRHLDRYVTFRTRHSSIAYPVGYGFSKFALKKLCRQYKKAMHSLSAEAKRRCIRRFAPYNSVYFVLGYPCGHGTEMYFFKYYNCLTSTRRLPAVRRYRSHLYLDTLFFRCEKSAIRSIDDPSNDQCEAYDILQDCIYDHNEHLQIVARCGYQAWEVDFQHTSMAIRNLVPNCRLVRIFRPFRPPNRH